MFSQEMQLTEGGEIIFGSANFLHTYLHFSIICNCRIQFIADITACHLSFTIKISGFLFFLAAILDQH